MSAQLEETAILSLRAQILDNVRLIKHETEDPIITTACNPDGWTAIIFNNKSGYPIYCTLGGDPTVVAALRNMLKHTSEKVEDKFDHFREDSEYHDHETSIGIAFQER